MEFSSDIKESLMNAGIDYAAYASMIRALFGIGPEDPAIRIERKHDEKGSSITHATVSRQFDGFQVLAE